MADIINLNEIVNSVVEYEAGNGSLSAVIPANLSNMTPFTDGDNVAIDAVDVKKYE